MAEVEHARGLDPGLDAAIERMKADLADGADAEARARRTVEGMATVLQASLVLRHADPAVADVFCASRLGAGGHHFGTLKPDRRHRAIVERARPLLD
jgi:putative acyl-CoA dehydrogenase